MNHGRKPVKTSFTMDNEYKPPLPCQICSSICDKVGQKNKLGIIKTYCCGCFAKQDPKYTLNHYCKHCEARDWNKLWKKE